MAIQNSPPWIPFFGTGAPGGSVPITSPYFDTSTNPYTPYIYDHTATAWKKYGVAAAGSGNAQSIQGIAVSATPPANGQVLQYVAANNDYEPTTQGTGATPTIVQFAMKSATLGAVVMGTAPTNGNLLIAFCAHVATSITPGTGWISLFQTSASNDGPAYFYKVAGVGESTSQSPTTATSTGGIVIYELAAACSSLITSALDQTGIALVQPITSQKALGSIIIGAVVNRSTTVLSSVIGATLDGTLTGTGRSVGAFHVSTPIVGVNNVTPTFATTQGYVFMALSIG